MKQLFKKNSSTMSLSNSSSIPYMYINMLQVKFDFMLILI